MKQYEVIINIYGTQMRHYVWAWNETEAYDRAEEIASLDYEYDPNMEIEVFEV